MTSKTLGNLTDATALTGTEQVYVVQSSNSRKSTAQAIADLGTSQDNMTDGTTNKNYTATEQTKLAGIEEAADVTDATNVAAAGAVMSTATDASTFDFVLDEDDMASDSDEKVPTQQSVKAFVTDAAYFQRPEAGVVVRKVNAKLLGWIDPKDFGCVGDGTTDDAADFQACVTAAAGRVIWIDGLTIRVPTGNEITLPSTGLNLQGKGKIVYEGTGTLFLGAQIDVTTYSHVATAAQTVFTDADDYTGCWIEVYVNDVLKDHRNYTISHDADDLTITFITGATVDDAVDIKVYRMNPNTGVLAAHAQIIIGAGVLITTTQAAKGRAIAAAWQDAGFAAGRQTSSFVMAPGSVIRGETGDDGFMNAVWLHAYQNVQIAGCIFGIGANKTALNYTQDTTCQSALHLTGEFTPSGVMLYGGGQIGFFYTGITSFWGTIEGIQAAQFVWLNCGYAVDWRARTDNVGLLLTMNGCHANCYNGIVKTDLIGSVMVSDSDFFQGPNSTITQFIFFDITGSSTVHRIHDNQMQSFVTGASCVGVQAGSGVRNLRSYANAFIAKDSTSVFVGHSMKSGSTENVIGPNSYENVDRAVAVLSGATKIGILTSGDTFRNPPGAFSRYSMAGDNWWVNEKWLVLSAATQSVPDNAGTSVTFTTSRNPEGATVASSMVTIPAKMTTARFKGRFDFAANPTGFRGITIFDNSGPTETRVKTFMAAATFGDTICSFDIEIGVIAGHDYFVQAYQNSGAALNLNASDLRIMFGN